ncbi:polyamine deacetylase HDAC10 isoform X4 [Leopardus geoffroyi]|uniref:polyamine deacetylase HDAC10 isoform X4 n=1 Tax=Leopardus geoffroyi TaxID=46844 RepID=UPI001E260051|nr:polyamine deacetylase HDAC10 isoform X4 [Leopardus geoffroyi]XP_045319052.1 polyamine deacetylase HDAC10 isoform X4 [Leopardus geoffroyi]
MGQHGPRAGPQASRQPSSRQAALRGGVLGAGSESEEVGKSGPGSPPVGLLPCLDSACSCPGSLPVVPAPGSCKEGTGSAFTCPARVAQSDHGCAMRTALVYHEDMTAARLLWEDPECEIERPERLTTALERLRQWGLEQRCLQVAAREASEAELGLVHSPEYVSLLRGTQTLSTRELQALCGQYDAVYFHPSTFHCARLAVGAALQLVDAVLTGAVHNGLALVRPPGHHSQRAAANGFCVFNNVAIAAKYAKRRHGLHSVLYFSWHRYEHGRFWPYLRESDADAVGQGQGRGFTVNLPWNQVGMGNADYVAAFLHVLLPVAFEFDPELVLISAGFDSAIGDPEGQMRATPECFSHLTQLLQVLAGGRVCAVLEGGYHLESLSQSVCMVVKALLGDPALPLSGPMEPHRSALESIQSVRAAQAPHWKSLRQQGSTPILNPSTYSLERRASPVSPGGPKFKAAEAQASAALSSLLDQLHLNPTLPVRTAVALTAPDAALVLPADVLRQEGSAPQEETRAWARLHEALAQDKALTALGKVLHLLNGILDGQVSSGMAATPEPAAAPTLDVVIRRSLSHGARRLLCVAVGQLDRPADLADDGRNLWLNIRGKEAAAPSMFQVSVPLPGTTGGFVSCVLALVLPLAYGFQPDLVLVALGPAHGLQAPQAALLASLLRGPAGGRVLVLLEQGSTSQLAGILARVLQGQAPPGLGPFSMASPEDTQALIYLRGQLEAEWKMLQVAAPQVP